MTTPSTPKPSGWKDGGRYWTNDKSKYGVRYICKVCGRECLGVGSVERNHRPTCTDPVTVADFARAVESNRRFATEREAQEVRVAYVEASKEVRAEVRRLLAMRTGGAG